MGKKKKKKGGSHYFSEPDALRLVNCKKLPGERARKACREWNKYVENVRAGRVQIEETDAGLAPFQVEENKLGILKTGNEIVTDAGWEKMTFEEACRFFRPEEIRDWYESYWSGADLPDLLVEIGVALDLNDEKVVEKFIENYDWTPKEVQVVVAKAIYENHAWVRVLAISTPEMEEYCFHNHEMEAVYLGMHLRKYLNLDIPVINDCKNAVRHLYRSYEKIGWQPRNCVTKAHKLKIYQASKVYDEQSWDVEWNR